MTSKTLSLTPELYRYLQDHSLREPATMQAIREATLSKTNLSHIQVAPEQGQFMALLVKLMGAKRIIEVGTFAGYSTAWLASALPDEGELIACEIDADRVAIGQTFWDKAGLSDKITLRIGPALESLKALVSDGQTNAFDFVFIDADKQNYINYYELALQLIKPGGLIAIDNTLWSGKLANPSVHDPSTEAIRSLNSHLLNDQRVEISLVPIGDGLTLAYKQP